MKSSDFYELSPKKPKYKEWTFNHFVEVKKNNMPVTTTIIQQWALVAALQFMSPDFQLPNILYEHITHRTNLKM
jgi:hypothetical protein